MTVRQTKPQTLGTTKLKRARLRPPIAEFPEPVSGEWDDPPSFSEAIDLHIRRHRDSPKRLHRAITCEGDTFDWATIRSWRRGDKEPRSAASLEMLSRIEARYRLPSGYFRSKLSHKTRATTGMSLRGIRGSERRRLVWHLPDDFDRRPPAERQEILEWVRRVIISGSTEYRRFQALAIKDRYALRLASDVEDQPGSPSDLEDEAVAEEEDPEQASAKSAAPLRLQEEFAALLKFKTTTLVDVGFKRSGVWGRETALQKEEHLGLLFGALAASPTGSVKGFGFPRGRLTFALLVFPSVWDWYVQWRERRRGFYTRWEVDMLRLALALTRKDYGWLRQSPHLADRLVAVRGLVGWDQVVEAKADWDAACDRLYAHGLARAREIERVARVHRDPFEPILPILEADSPLGEYRAITEEIVERLPDERRYPRCVAEAVRSFLMLRLGLHLGVRQKNLRQLIFQRRGGPPTPERQLETEKRGELRWSDRDSGWEVLIPASAFKNYGSSYFGKRPFRLVLPDLARLYEFIDDYLVRHRPRLLNGCEDPGTFFVKTVKATSKSAAYDQTTFYEAWRLTIARYGVFNPYTGRGVIRGLLPHGPHNLRDVLATHILKKTGSYEQASYAIQDTPETVAHHYGRFLPQDKAALAAQILNKAWQDERPDGGSG
jgi:hypothetical protein